MPRLRNKSSGVVVNVSDEVAREIASHFEPVGDDAPEGETEKKPARRRSSKSEK